MRGLTLINLYWDAFFFFLKGFFLLKFYAIVVYLVFIFFFWYIFNFINLCKFLLKKLIRLLASSFPKFWISTSSFRLSYIVCIVSVSISTFYLGCTDAAKRPPHLRPTHKGRLCLRIRAASSFFFFVSRLASTRVESGRCAPIRAKLVCIGRNHRYLRQPANSIQNSKKKKKGAKRTIWLK